MEKNAAHLLKAIVSRRRSGILVRGAQWSFDPKGGGALSPKLLKIGGFPLKLPENCMILKKSWGQGGLGPQGPPGSATGVSGADAGLWSRDLWYGNRKSNPLQNIGQEKGHWSGVPLNHSKPCV